MTIVKSKLAREPQNADLRVMQAELLALLGREEEALREARVVEELQRGQFWLWSLSPARTYATLGRAGEALRFLRTAEQWHAGQVNGWPMTTALLRMDPSWDPIRQHAKFVERLATAAAAEHVAYAGVIRPEEKSRVTK